MARLARMPARKNRSTRNFYDTQKVRRIHHGRCNPRGFDNKEHRSTSGTTKRGIVGERLQKITLINKHERECSWEKRGIEGVAAMTSTTVKIRVSVRTGAGCSRKPALNKCVGWCRCRHSVPRARNGELTGVGSSIILRDSPALLGSNSPETTDVFIFSSMLRRIALQSSTPFVAPIPS